MDTSNLLREEPLNKIELKRSNSSTIRYVSFNVNGAKTLFNYYPWNRIQQSYDLLFKSFDADIISLQELKLTSSTISSVNIGHLAHYRSFISLPKFKKGYSGVGLFVRIPANDESDTIKHHLHVVKAEEGLTGFLKSPDFPGIKYRDLGLQQSVGGYPDDLDENEGLKIDSEGRCVVVELACNIVIFSLYCPANSMASDEGETFRLLFLKTLLERCYKIKHDLGKEVVIIGDINVSIDLIDNADGINDRIKQRLIQLAPDGPSFENLNYQECLNFRTTKPSRKLLNEYVVPSLKSSITIGKQFMYDTTRHVQGRKMGLYTVWNTMKGARQSNYGSRVDLILTSSEDLVKNLSNANIWPFICGSDHCPVFSDFEVSESEVSINTKPTKLKFEAQNFYKLVKHHDIFHMFNSVSGPVKRSREDVNITEPDNESKKRKLVYTSRKTNRKTDKQKSISSYFLKDELNTISSSSQGDTSSSSQDQVDDPQNKKLTKPISIASISDLIHGKPPNCDHGVACQMKTSLANAKTRGKKYWCCPKTKRSMQNYNSEDNDQSDYQCSFFQWVGNNNS